VACISVDLRFHVLKPEAVIVRAFWQREWRQGLEGRAVGPVCGNASRLRQWWSSGESPFSQACERVAPFTKHIPNIISRWPYTCDGQGHSLEKKFKVEK
jgi:hypothetical protein